MVRRLMSKRAMILTGSTHSSLQESNDVGLHTSNPGPNCFDNLPLEMIHQIAHLLNDTDLCAFRKVCKTTHAAVDDHFWRMRFLKGFEKPHAASKIRENVDFRVEYQKRRDILVHVPRFVEQGNNARERLALEVLRELILDSYSGQTSQSMGIYQSSNMEYVQNFAQDSNIITDMFAQYTPPIRNRYAYHPGPSPLLRTLQILLAPTMLQLPPPGTATEINSFPDSQLQVYQETCHAPIFLSTGLNTEWLLHNLNFWRYHMHCVEELTLNASYEALEPHLRPRYWRSAPTCLATEPTIGKTWKGAFGYATEQNIIKIRQGRGEAEHIPDHFCGPEQMSDFQSLKLQVLPEGEGEETWPWVFEQHLQALNPPIPQPPSRRHTRAQKHHNNPPSSPSPPPPPPPPPKSYHFSGTGLDASEPFLASGWFNPLPPHTTSSIPGFTRMTMMKFFQDEDTGQVEMDDDAVLWAYEGVGMPGGQIVVGRWWRAGVGVGVGNAEGEGEEMYCGPFILWCVDGAGEGEGEGEG